jgi:hypothetical protein
VEAERDAEDDRSGDPDPQKERSPPHRLHYAGPGFLGEAGGFAYHSRRP